MSRLKKNIVHKASDFSETRQFVPETCGADFNATLMYVHFHLTDFDSGLISMKMNILRVSIILKMDSNP